MAIQPGTKGASTSSKTKTSTSTKTSTVANPSHNVTVTGGAGRGANTTVYIGKVAPKKQPQASSAPKFMGAIGGRRAR